MYSCEAFVSKQLLRRQQIASVTIRQQFAVVQSGNGSGQLIVGDSQGGHKEPHIDLWWNSQVKHLNAELMLKSFAKVLFLLVTVLRL